jgi:Cytochrome c7 and related cytochrome c
LRRLALLIAVVLGFAGAACSTRLWTRFPHEQHLANLECGVAGKPDCLSCTSCHQGETAVGLAWQKPPAALCEQCHKPSEPKYSYAKSTRAPESPRPAGLAILFGHDEHLNMPEVKGQCVKCHAGAVGNVAGKPLFPAMATCLGCHQHKAEFEQNVCGTCHKPADLRGLKPVSFLAHTGGWIRRHAAPGRDVAQTCTQCHAQAQCDSCHDATQTLRVELRNPDAIGREFVHRFDFLSRHVIEARSQPAMCQSCHVKQDCDGCHVRRGVSGGAVDGRNPHPPNWAVGVGVAGNQHGRAARRDISSCAACHDQGPATNCVRCHAPGGIGGTPHPPGWRSTQSSGAGACANCHGGAL